MEDEALPPGEGVLETPRPEATERDATVDRADAIPADGVPAPAIPADAQAVSLETTREPFEPQDFIRKTLAALPHAPERDPKTQRFTKRPHLAMGKTLSRSVQFWRAVEPAKRELVERVRRDFACDGDSVETLLGLIDGYAEARLFRMTMFLRIVDTGGPISPKGKMRAFYDAYLKALDRETKLAMVLGLERRSKPVQPLDAIRQAIAQANSPTEEEG